MSVTVFVVSIRGFEGEMEAVAAFSTYRKSLVYVEHNGFVSWAIEELIINEECHEETNV
ncbi:TPA: hypothetical protein QCJ60_004920 [Enterobacter sichuanensis]|nr:hypothetical protein [Enterobacter sichuanensis]